MERVSLQREGMSEIKSNKTLKKQCESTVSFPRAKKRTSEAQNTPAKQS